jgi:hypothetical protein
MVVAGAPNVSKSDLAGATMLMKTRGDRFCHRVTWKNGKLVQADENIHPLLLSPCVTDSLTKYPYIGQPRLIVQDRYVVPISPKIYLLIMQPTVLSVIAACR